jgi:allantoin racemase
MRIHIVTPVTTRGVRSLDDVAHLAHAGLTITHSILESGPPSIESEYDEALAVPATIAEVVKAERSGADAVILDCMGDPGMRAAREMVSIPVLGPGETSMHLAAMLGQRFGYVTVLNSVKPMTRNVMRLAGVEDRLASIRVVDIPVLELESRIDEAKQRLGACAVKAVEEDDADVIILGCTGFLGCASAIGAHLADHGHDVPVIDPVPATLCIAEGIVRAGLSHSKLCFPLPRPKVIAGYDMP